MFKKVSDKEYLAKIKKQYLSRDKTGRYLTVFALLMIAGCVYGYQILWDQILEIANGLTSITTIEDKDIVESANNTALALGVSIGVSFGFALSGAVSILIHGLNLLYGSRKERILIKLSEELGYKGGDQGT